MSESDLQQTSLYKHFCHIVLRTVTTRIDAHMERINCHPVQIRRYYRQWDY